MEEMNRQRWYDQHPVLGPQIERLKHLRKVKREELLQGVKEMLMQADPNLIDIHVMDFPITMKRRWYDKDPYTWLTINALKFCPKELQDEVARFLSEK